MRWLLLISTCISLYMTLESLGTIEHLKKNRILFKKWIWGNTNAPEFDKPPDSFKIYLETKLSMWAVLIPIFTTIVLARATYSAFF